MVFAPGGTRSSHISRLPWSSPTSHRSLTWELRERGPQQVHVILLTQVLAGQAAFCLYGLLPAGDWEVETERKGEKVREIKEMEREMRKRKRKGTRRPGQES